VYNFTYLDAGVSDADGDLCSCNVQVQVLDRSVDSLLLKYCKTEMMTPAETVAMTTDDDLHRTAPTADGHYHSITTTTITTTTTTRDVKPRVNFRFRPSNYVRIRIVTFGI